MNNWLSTIFIQYVEKYRALDECQKEKIKYRFCTIIGEIEKIVIFFIFFILIKRGIPFCIVLITLVVVRRYVGGVHFNNFVLCFWTSFVICGLTIWMGEKIKITEVYKSFIYLGGLTITYLFSPFPSENKVLGTKEQRYKTKGEGLFFMGVLIVVGNMIKRWEQYILWSMVVIEIESMIKVFIMCYKKGGRMDGT